MTYVRLESKSGLEWIEYSSAKRKGFVKRKFSYSEGGSGRSGEMEGSDTTIIGRHQANAEIKRKRKAGWKLTHYQKNNNPLTCDMTREQMFHELKHAKKKRPQRQRIAIVLNTERKCGRRTNPPTVLQLGKIIEFEVINPKTKAEGKVNARTKQIGKLMRNARLAWTGNGKRGTLHICTPIKNSRYNGKKHTVSKNVRRKHMNFHGADVGRVLPANMPKRPRKVTQIGLVKAVVYQAVGIKSPSKQKWHWHHLFGDSGHRGLKKGPRYMPMLATDGKNLFIIRRPGNTYYVGMYDDGHAWIIG